MKNFSRCCFAGHSDIYSTDEAREKIKQIAENLIVNHKVKEFWVGNYGNFDGCSACVVRELKEKYPDITLELVIPYLTKEVVEYKCLYDKQYDNILVADIPEKTPRRYHITKCNEYMVDNSDYMICYINRSWGGAITTYNYAKRKKKQIFNIAKEVV